MTFSEVIEKETSHTESSGKHISSDIRIIGDISFEIFSIGATILGDVGALIQRDDETEYGTQSGQSSTRHFVLGDPENGDEFEVMVCSIVLIRVLAMLFDLFRFLQS